MNDIILAAENISKSYQDGKRQLQVLDNINLLVKKGELVAIVGASGSGKSTLLHLLGGLDKPTSGDIYIAGKNFSQCSEIEKSALRNRYMGFVYQFHHLLPELSALENVALPLLLGKSAHTRAYQNAKAILTSVGLGERVEHRLNELSGGERQRVALARALVGNPLCVLADEPTGNLDQNTASMVFDLMLDLNARYQISLVIVTHDLTLAKKMHRVYELNAGRLIKQQ
jgi:lipoprotein-releasing system ATP-binding protein